MGLITRHLLKDLFVGLAFALAAFTIVMLLAGIGQEAQRMNLGIGAIARLIPYSLPQALAFSIPATALLAVCQVYGRMSRQNEIVAVKSLGGDPKLLLWPAWTMGALLSVACVVLNDLAFSWGARGIQDVVIQSVEEIAYGTLTSKLSYSSDNFSIVVREVDGRRLISPEIDFAIGGGETINVTAKEARLESNLERGTLKLVLFDSVVTTTDGVRGHFPGRTEREIPLAFASTKDDASGSPTQTPMREIPDAIASQQRDIRRRQQEAAAASAISVVTGDLASLAEKPWKDRAVGLTAAESRLTRLRLELWRRWAGGFACLGFVVIGAPWAILMQNENFVSTFFKCFAPILLIYFPLFLTALARAKGGTLHPVFLFSGDVVCLAAGWILTRYVERY